MAETLAVIGGGVVGLNVALALQREGFAVTVYDRDEATDAASRGASHRNAGGFAFSDIFPLASPGIMARAPGWLLDPLGPLAIRPGHALALVPWLWRFWRATRPERYRAGVAAQTALMTRAQAALERQLQAIGGREMISAQGQLQVYEGAASFAASSAEWDLRREHGVAFDLLDSPDQIADIQPGLSPRFTHAGFTHGWINTIDPARWMAHLRTAFLRAGGEIAAAGVQAVKPGEVDVMLETTQGERRADRAVIAAGAWSHRLTAGLGDRLPLETERGYNTTLPPGAFDLRTQLTFSEHGFVISRIGEGLRVGGAVELGGLELAPNFRRSEALLQRAKRFMPALKTDGGAQWMGFRPTLPDSLPVIDHASATDRIVYAFGHGHLGLTQAAGTAEIVADLMLGRDPGLVMAPFRAARFG